MREKEMLARARLNLLEHNSDLTTETSRAKEQTREDDINDRKFHSYSPPKKPHKDDPEIEAEWIKDSKGNWVHPDFEEE